MATLKELVEKSIEELRALEKEAIAARQRYSQDIQTLEDMLIDAEDVDED